MYINICRFLRQTGGIFVPLDVSVRERHTYFAPKIRESAPNEKYKQSDEISLAGWFERMNNDAHMWVFLTNCP